MTSHPSPADSVARQFIIQCLISRHSPDALDNAALISSGESFDWGAVRSAAESENVQPLLFYALRGNTLLPAPLLEQWHRTYVQTGALNALRMRELAAVLTTLRASNIEALVLKGSSLLERVYGNIALRPMLDMDILVRRDDVPTALKVLEAFQYKAISPELSTGALLAYENEIALWKDSIGSGGWMLEVHWRLFDSPFYQRMIPEEVMWETTGATMIDGVDAATLTPELDFLHLCGHLILHHQGVGLIWWNDLNDYLHVCRTELDWELLLNQARRLNLIRSLQYVMDRLGGDWGAPIPNEFARRLAQTQPSPEEMRVYTALTSGNRPPARRLLDDVAGQATWKGKARFVYHNLFPSGAYMDERYGIRHAYLRVFYYPYRWFRGLADLLAADKRQDGNT